MTRRILLLNAFLSVGALYGLTVSPSRANGLPLPASAACRTEILRVVKRWGSLEQWKELPASAAAQQSFHSPTATFGTWVEVHFGTSESTVLRISSRSQVGAHWTAPGCAAELAVRTDHIFQNEGPGDLTDTELASVLRERKTGVIYIWSPQMGLSLRGVREIQAAAKALNLPITYVLDSHADGRASRAPAAQAGIPNQSVRGNRSLELIYRGGELHFPAVFVYSHGALTASMLPGFSTRELYREFISEQLKP